MNLNDVAKVKMGVNITATDQLPTVWLLSMVYVQ